VRRPGCTSGRTTNASARPARLARARPELSARRCRGSPRPAAPWSRRCARLRARRGRARQRRGRRAIGSARRRAARTTPMRHGRSARRARCRPCSRTLAKRRNRKSGGSRDREGRSGGSGHSSQKTPRRAAERLSLDLQPATATAAALSLSPCPDGHCSSAAPPTCQSRLKQGVGARGLVGMGRPRLGSAEGRDVLPSPLREHPGSGI